MKNLIAAILMSGWASISVAAELPVSVVDGVLVEEAWASRQTNGVEIYLVINNRSTTGVGPLEIEVLGATAAKVVRSTGKELVPTLPPHSELYMQPEGVRIEASGVPLGPIIPVSISLGADRITVEAQVLPADEDMPDHHDYVHP